MKFVFDIHNTMGRFWNEKIYKEKVQKLCKKYVINVLCEVPIKVTFKDFYKYYFLDLLIENSAIYELKTVDSLSKKDEQQLINYLLLINLNHGKLVNFKTSSVESRFCSNRLSLNIRKNYCFDDRYWDDSLQSSKPLKQILKNLLNDWGAFLDYNLYKEAIIHFLGGKDKVIKNINVIDRDKIIGQQKFILINECTVLIFSGISKYYKNYACQISEMLKYTNLKYAQWINFNNNEIKLTTIKK